jgi:hypothetical protein
LLTLALEKERQRAVKLQADLKAMGATDTSGSAGAAGGGLDAEASEQLDDCSSASISNEL